MAPLDRRSQDGLIPMHCHVARDLIIRIAGHAAKIGRICAGDMPTNAKFLEVADSTEKIQEYCYGMQESIRSLCAGSGGGE